MTVAVVLAGGQKSGLQGVNVKKTCEAMIPIGKRFMIEYVIEALLNSSHIRDIVIAGPVSELERLFRGQTRITLVEGGSTPVQSFIKALESINDMTKRVLIVTADVPLLTARSLDYFIEVCEEMEGDLFYPIVSREVNEKTYPGVKRTYVKLMEGQYTGGNIIYLNPKIVKSCVPVAEELVRLRKRPLALISYVGWGLLLRYTLGILSLNDAEKKASEILGIRGVGVFCPFPEIGIDVDKPSDLNLVQEKLYSSDFGASS